MEEKMKRKLWLPVIKNKQTGKYLAVLSDTSLDRDGEAMSKELVTSWAENKALPSLADHVNSMKNWVGGWTDFQVSVKNGETALFAEPWFFSEDANPLAGQIKRQVDEAIEKGLNPGISVGAIIHDSEMRKMGGNDVRVFTKGELLEATWVPIQSNRNASFGHVAKGFDVDKFLNTQEEKKLEKEFTQKDLDSAVEKKVAEAKESFEKQLKEKDVMLDKQKNQIDTLSKTLSETKEALEKSNEAAIKADKEAKEAKDKALEKQKFADAGSEETVDIIKELESGKLPIMRG